MDTSPSMLVSYPFDVIRLSDDNGTVLTETDADGTITTYTYDSLSRVISRNVQKGDLSKTWTTDYDYEDIALYIGAACDTDAGLREG